MRKVSSGFTLVELMVALVIGLLVVAGALQIFVMTKRTFNQMDGLASRQEVLRFISDAISFDIRTAGSVSVNPLGDDGELAVLDCKGVGGVADAKNVLWLLDQSFSRLNDPYCSGAGEALDRVAYFSVEPEASFSALHMCYVCVDGEDVEAASDVYLVQEGVRLQFESRGVGVVDTTIVFDVSQAYGPAGQSLDDRTFTFRTVSRSEVVDLSIK